MKSSQAARRRRDPSGPWRGISLRGGATSLVGVFLHWRRGRFHNKAALLLSVTGMGGAYLGSAFTHLVSSSALLLMFAAIMLKVGLIMLRGGFFIVPALVLFAGLDTKKAVGTSLAIIALNSFSGLIRQFRHAPVDWRITAEFIVLALGGMLMGLALSNRVSEAALRRAFAVLLLIAAVIVAG